MAEIEWKGAVWRAAFGSLSVKELLTILKGFGPMEILEFEKPELAKGQVSISLSPEGKKQITLYHLEVEGVRRQGQGRAALQWLKQIFKGDLYVEDPGVIHVKNANQETLLFWVKMFREGLIEALESEGCALQPEMSEEDIGRLEAALRGRGTEESSRTMRNEC